MLLELLLASLVAALACPSCIAWNFHNLNRFSEFEDSVLQSTFATSRRTFIWTSTGGIILQSQPAIAVQINDKGNDTNNNPLVKVTDPQTYSALAYSPSSDDDKFDDKNKKKPPPLILVLHGAGKNDQDIWELADIHGEHAGLIPSLIASGLAPNELTNNFSVLAPYTFGKRSFYEEPRRNVLQFLDWASSNEGRQAGCPIFDPNRIIIFGFSDGATVAVELLTTGRFAAGVIAAYGFTGELPNLAVQRLANIPMWVFHSADDVIFPVKCSDRLVRRLRESVTSEKSADQVIRYSRYDKDQEGFVGDVRGHSTGITASKLNELYEWMLSVVQN